MDGLTGLGFVPECLGKLGAASEGAAKLIATVAHVFGLDARGERKRADAKAYARIKEAETNREVARIDAEAKLELEGYVWSRELLRMNNAKAVVGKAGKYMDDVEPISPEPVNQDWLNRFFSIVEDVSDYDLQEMWGRILAGEVKRPRSYSLRTLELLRSITKEEAEIFEKATACHVENEYICTERFALSLDEQLLLMETGLLTAEGLTWNLPVSPLGRGEVKIDNKSLLVLWNNTSREIKCTVSLKKLSTAGHELMSIVFRESNARDMFFRHLAKLFKQQGIKRVQQHEIIQIGPPCTYSTNYVELMPDADCLS